MTKVEIRRWRRDVYRAVVQIDRRGFEKNPEMLGAAMILAAVLAVGTDVSALVMLTGHQQSFVKRILKGARKAKIISGQTIRAGWDMDHGGLSLLLDTMAVVGDIDRVPNPTRSAAQKRAALTRRRSDHARRPPLRRAKAIGEFTPKYVSGKTHWYAANQRTHELV